MGVNFPLVDIRREVDGTWDLRHETAEAIQVPNTPPYVVRLIEVPDDGTIEGTVQISGLTLTSSYPPSSGQFYVNFLTGDIVFHADQADDTYDVDYWQKGSLVEAADINYLWNRQEDLIDRHLIQTVTVSAGTVENIDTVIDTIKSVKWIIDLDLSTLSLSFEIIAKIVSSGVDFQVYGSIGDNALKAYYDIDFEISGGYLILKIENTHSTTDLTVRSERIKKG